MTTPIPKNIYHKRLVADSAAKQCDICYRPSTCVLITPDQSDWFYICPGHLKDRGFCSPAGDDGKPKAEVVGESDAEKEKREKENREKEELRLQVIKEYEEKLARKDKDKKGDKEDKDKDKKVDTDKKEEEEVKNKKEGPKKVEPKKVEPKKVEPKKEEEPRVFVLHKKIFDRRVLLKRQSFAAKRNLERMKTPGFWPSVPSGLP